jgi:hypothetical protein
MDTPSILSRCCTMCREVVPLTLENFHRDTADSQGFQHTCKRCKKISVAQWEHENPTLKRAKRQRWERKLRLDALLHYSAGTPICACCGEANVEFLAIDHIDGQRLLPSHHGAKLFRWLKAQGYPPGYRVLCHNCNQALAWYGYCPHQIRSVAEDAV